MAHQGASGVANEHLLGDDREYSSSSLSIESSLRYDSTWLVASNQTSDPPLCYAEPHGSEAARTELELMLGCD